MGLKLEETVKGIMPVSDAWRRKARKHLNNLAIPVGSLGRLLDIAEQLAAIKESLKPSTGSKVVVTMAGDHGVVEEGVSTCPQEVTLQMVYNFVAGGAGINALAGVAGARVVVVDMGRPLLDLDMRLGEGTGAALAMCIVEGAGRVIGEMLTFEDAGVARNKSREYAV